MQNIFVKEYNPRDVGRDSPLNGLLEQIAGGVAYGLAQDVVSSSTAVSVQVFQATLLAAFNEVLYGRAIAFTPEIQQTILKAALELGQTYAKLAPSRGTIAPADNSDYDFLDILWRSQQPDASGSLPDRWTIASQLDRGVAALGRLLSGVSDREPGEVIHFIEKHLSAVN